MGLLVFSLAGWRRGLAPQALVLLVTAGLAGGALGAIAAQGLVAGTWGKSFYGGLLGGWVAVLATKRWMGLRRDTGDLFALALSAGEAVGRWGCFLTGCCRGLVTACPLAVDGRHPTQVYQSLASGALFLWLGWRFLRGAPEGSLFRLYLVVQLVVRFCLEFLREGAGAAAGLRPVQWVCLALLLLVARGYSPPHREVAPG